MYELQKWYESRPDCLLKRIRKNENALKEYKLSIIGMGKGQLKGKLGHQYEYIFKT